MLYIIRHGKTDWNERHKLQGRTDIPINAEGRRMAEEAASACKDVHLDVCYCSPLIRARETAQIVLKGRGVPILYDDRLREMGFGEYEGVENSFRIPDCRINTLFFHPEEYIADRGAESLEELFSRTGEFLREVIYPGLEKEQDILIMGHGAANSSIVCQVRNIPLAEFWSAGIDNCRLMQLI